MDLTYKVVIPARMKSSRLPGKPLVDIAGKSLIQRTFEQCLLAVDRENIVVLTDDHQIIDHCSWLNIPVEMTSENCLTGTDRVAEYASRTNYNYYINVQGDEPLMNPDDIKQTIKALELYNGEIINGYCPISSETEFKSLSIPKVVFSESGKLMYMSRSPIPGNKTDKFQFGYRQVCIYAFPKSALKQFLDKSQKTKFEEIEDIEILRFVEMDIPVKMIPLSANSIAVDNPEDIQKVIERL